jgi:L-ascorbate metabolism protein UlaG (beta-lactamase superfamily)
MFVTLTWLGHATWLVKNGKTSILVDPFLDQSPVAPVKAADVNPDFILVSHGHQDHIADCAAIAARTGAQVITNYEISLWLEGKHGVRHTTGMNIGGNFRTSFGNVKMVPALHSSSLPDGSYGGNPAGFVVTIADKKIYFACDTALFSDMKLIGSQGLDLAVFPIGDLFTMGIDDSVAATRLVEPLNVAPSHYNTWPPIQQDVPKWAERIRRETTANPFTPRPGESFQI